MWVTEVRVADAGGHDQAMERELGAVVEDDEPITDPAHLAEPDRCIGLAAKYRSDRGGDVGGVQAGGRDLVQERLEHVVVSAVDDEHLDRSVGQRLCGREPAEPATDDDDPLDAIRYDVVRHEPERSEDAGAVPMPAGSAQTGNRLGSTKSVGTSVGSPPAICAISSPIPAACLNACPLPPPPTINRGSRCGRPIWN